MKEEDMKQKQGWYPQNKRFVGSSHPGSNTYSSCHISLTKTQQLNGRNDHVNEKPSEYKKWVDTHNRQKKKGFPKIKKKRNRDLIIVKASFEGNLYLISIVCPMSLFFHDTFCLFSLGFVLTTFLFRSR